MREAQRILRLLERRVLDVNNAVRLLQEYRDRLRLEVREAEAAIHSLCPDEDKRE